MFTFQFLNDKIPKATILPNCQVPKGFLYITVNLIIWKLKIKRLVCLSFLWWQVFWGNERKIFPHIPDLKVISIIKLFDRITQPLHPVTFYLAIFNIFKDLILSLEKLGNLAGPGMSIEEGYIKRSFIFSYPPLGIRQ